MRADVTAASLMVWPVKTVEAGSSVASACSLMDRYLIGALPVLSTGRVIGILTRRLGGGVIAHGMGELPVESFMLEAHPIDPETTLEALRAVVRQRAPKLLPVLDGEDLVGVVTRTSIMRALADAAPPELGRVPLEALAPALQPVVRTVSTVAAACDVAVCMVGGIVRDLLLGVANEDLDLLVEGEGEHVAAFLERLTDTLGARRLDHARFGTAALELADGQRVDVATARIETYGQPAALPQVEPGSLWLDLRRRDFTFNSLAVRLDGDHLGVLMDPFGGRQDLAAGRIRVLHGLSFIDDPTRIFRAVRFEQRFGFRIEMETERLIHNAAKLGLIERLSSERLSAEIEQILSEPACVGSVRRLRALELLPSLRLGEPDDAQLDALARAPSVMDRFRESHAHRPMPGAPPAVWQLRVMVLLVGLSSEQVHAALARLAIRGPIAAHIERACRVVGPTLGALAADTLLPSQIVELLEPLGVESWALVRVMASSPVVAERVDAFLNAYRNVRAPLDGKDLQALGLEPGPHFRALLRSLRDRALDGTLTREEAVAWVRSVAPAPGGGASGA